MATGEYIRRVMIRRLIGRQNQRGWPVAGIDFWKKLGWKPAGTFRELVREMVEAGARRDQFARLSRAQRTVRGSRNAVGVFSPSRESLSKRRRARSDAL